MTHIARVGLIHSGLVVVARANPCCVAVLASQHELTNAARPQAVCCRCHIKMSPSWKIHPREIISELISFLCFLPYRQSHKKSSHHRIAPLSRKVSPDRQSTGKNWIRPARVTAPGRGKFLPVSCRPGRLFWGGWFYNDAPADCKTPVVRTVDENGWW